ncbi:MAG: replication initiator protein A [Saprospiraceae bacterium]
MKETAQENLSLLPERYPSKDFFIADIFDSLPFKDDMASMEHPIFSLSKKRDLRDIVYRNGDVTVTIKPTSDGLPTIFDKDVLLYCGSILMEQVNKGLIPPKTLRISSHDLLIATNRTKDGDSYARLKKALDRLKGVSVKTNIKTNKREVTKAFGLIESYEIVESSRVKNRMIRLEITLSDWFYNSILGKEVLTINRDYFRLGKALERRLYEIARKHCGHGNEWKIGLEKLKEKTGSTSPLKKFRFFIREIEKHNHLPDYTIRLANDEMAVFEPRKEFTSIDDLPRISPKVIEKARKIVEKTDSQMNFSEIHSQFSKSLVSGFKPDNADGAFINFVKKKIGTI